MTKRIPEGFHAITPHLVVNDADAAIAFYKKAFGATEICRLPAPDNSGRLMHAEIRIGDSVVMLADTFPEFCAKSKSAKDIGHTPVTVHLYVDNVDQVFQKAIDAGAKEEMPISDMFWGDRYGRLTDPFGHAWAIATHVKDVSPEEMAAGAKACMLAGAKA